MFFAAPCVSKLFDAKGQRRVAPFATIVTLAGLAILLACTWLHGPAWALLLGAVLMGFVPNAPALMRARWQPMAWAPFSPWLFRSARSCAWAPSAKASLRLMTEASQFVVSVSFAVAARQAPSILAKDLG